MANSGLHQRCQYTQGSGDDALAKCVADQRHAQAYTVECQCAGAARKATQRGKARNREQARTEGKHRGIRHEVREPKQQAHRHGRRGAELAEELGKLRNDDDQQIRADNERDDDDECRIEQRTLQTLTQFVVALEKAGQPIEGLCAVTALLARCDHRNLEIAEFVRAPSHRDV